MVIDLGGLVLCRSFCAVAARLVVCGVATLFEGCRVSVGLGMMQGGLRESVVRMVRRSIEAE